MLDLIEQETMNDFVLKQRIIARLKKEGYSPKKIYRIREVTSEFLPDPEEWITSNGFMFNVKAQDALDEYAAMMDDLGVKDPKGNGRQRYEGVVLQSDDGEITLFVLAKRQAEHTKIMWGRTGFGKSPENLRVYLYALMEGANPLQHFDPGMDDPQATWDHWFTEGASHKIIAHVYNEAIISYASPGYEIVRAAISFNYKKGK